MTRYLGGATDSDHPDFPDAMLVNRMGPDGRFQAIVLHAPTCEVVDGVVEVGYHLLDATLDDADAMFLVVKVLLVDHANHYYGEHAGGRRIRLTNLDTGESFVLPYPKHAPSQADPVRLWQCEP